MMQKVASCTLVLALLLTCILMECHSAPFKHLNISGKFSQSSTDSSVRKEERSCPGMCQIRENGGCRRLVGCVEKSFDYSDYNIG